MTLKKSSHSKYRIPQCSRQTCSKRSQRLLSPPPTPPNSLLWLCDKDQYLLKDKPGPPPIWAFKACWTALYHSVKGYACHEGASSRQKAVPPVFAPEEDFPMSPSSCKAAPLIACCTIHVVYGPQFWHARRSAMSCTWVQTQTNTPG